jgi:ribosomal protein L11 methyltransferase
MSSATTDFRSIEVRVADAWLAELAVAEAWESGAAGTEERDESEGGVTVTRLLVYAPAATADVVRAAIVRVVGGEGRVGSVEPVAAVDWCQRWTQDLEPIVVSPRLVVRASFTEVELAPGQSELVIDPGQAFGTGAHASTLLALQWVDSLAERAGGSLEPSTRVLDVGTGTGVLALAALCLGANRAVALDVDPLAAPEARRWAEKGCLAGRFQVFTGPLAALAAEPFDLVLANMLSSELLPLAGELACATRSAGWAVLSGLLAHERESVEARLSAAGLVTEGVRSKCDGAGDEWISLLMIRS